MLKFIYHKLFIPCAQVHKLFHGHTFIYHKIFVHVHEFINHKLFISCIHHVQKFIYHKLFISSTQFYIIGYLFYVDKFRYIFISCAQGHIIMSYLFHVHKFI